MTYTKTTWNPGDDISVAKLNNMELQYDAAKTDFGPVTVTLTVSKQGESLHYLGADYIVASGSTSAQVTINTAITAAANAGGGTVLLLEGVYTIDNSILVKDNVTLSGVGHNTIIRLKAGIGSNINMILNDSYAAPPGNRSIIIKDMTVDGNKAYQTYSGYGICLVNCTDLTTRILIRNCYIINIMGSYAGIGVTSSQNVVIDSCTITGTTKGIYGSGSSLQCRNTLIGWCAGIGVDLGGCTDSILANLTVRDNAQHGIELEGYTVRTAISGCVVYNNLWSGISVTGAGTSNNDIMGNICKNNGSVGITVNASAHYNNVIGNSCVLNAYGIQAASVLYALINGNMIGYNSIHGIYLSGPQKSKVSNNTVFENGHEGIMMANGTSTTLIEGNNITGNGQAADKTYDNILVAESSNYCSIIGNWIHKGSNSACIPGWGIRILTGCNYHFVTGNYLVEAGEVVFLDLGTGTDKKDWMGAGNKIA